MPCKEGKNSGGFDYRKGAGWAVLSQIIQQKMNDSEEEGFYEPSLETFTQKQDKLDASTSKKKSQGFKTRPALCVHYQISLYQYPQQLDNPPKIATNPTQTPQLQDALQSISKREQPAIPLSDFFPRNLQCLYNKFREKIAFKRDLTLIIRNVTRLARDQQLATFATARPNSNDPVTFSSDFQCGNLHLVFKERKLDTFYLLLQNDINTHGFNFWFYFNVRTTTRKKCSFVIVNLARFVSFQGKVNIVTYSSREGQMERKVGFITTVSRFCRCDNDQTYWSLLFQYEFEENSDVYFALTVPYSYSKAIKMVKTTSQLQVKHLKIAVEAVAKTPLGNIVPVVKLIHEKCGKKIVFITARQHSCETVGSFICESIIKQLCDGSQQSNSLLQRFQFFIIPMVNADGVIHGNSRTNLMGYDLNRCWDRPGLMQSIECEQIWKYIQHIHNKGHIVWSFDLHGHSRQHGFFAYFSDKSDKSLIMSHFLSTKSSIFRANKCAFQVGASKKQSIRGQLSQRLKIQNAVTIQASLFGYHNDQGRFIAFQTEHFDEMSNAILYSLLQTEKMAQKKVLKQKNMQQIVKKMQKRSENQKDIDSDSDPQGDYLKKEERKQVEQMVQPKFQRSTQSNLQQTNESKVIINRKRVKTESSPNQRHKSQRQSPVRIHLAIQAKAQKPAEPQKKIKTQLFNITFTNRSRSRSYHKNTHQSQQFKKELKIINLIAEQRQREYEDKKAIYRRTDLQQPQESLKKSLQMRKKIKLAFDNRLKTQRDAYSSNLINPTHLNKVQVLVYPALRERQKLQLQNNLKSKRQITKQLRNQSFGGCLYSRFHNSFYLKAKHHPSKSD